MRSRDFAFWLQGFFEIDGSNSLSETQVNVIKNHLSLVFIHEIDPSMGPKEHQNVLNAAHKPTLEQLGEVHGFPVDTNVNPAHGKKPGPDYLYSSIHGWYNPEEGVPRC